MLRSLTRSIFYIPKNCIQGIFPCVQDMHAQREIFIHVWVDLILPTQISIFSDNFYPLTTFL